MINNPFRGQLVWAWISVSDECCAPQVPKQIKWVSGLSYCGFKYLEPEQDYKEACIYNDDTSLRGWRGAKEENRSSPLAETREELISFHVNKIKRDVVKLMEKLNYLERMKVDQDLVFRESDFY